jgi:ABC-type transporter MlaC component
LLESVKSDPEFAMSISISGASPASLFDTQKPATTLTAKPAEAQSAEQKFLEYAKMTPAERMHAQMLAQLGLTEDQFKAMSPADQQKIEDKIREMIKQQAANSNDKRTGLITDKSA